MSDPRFTTDLQMKLIGLGTSASCLWLLHISFEGNEKEEGREEAPATSIVHECQKWDQEQKYELGHTEKGLKFCKMWHYQLSWYFEWCIQWCTTSQGNVPWQPKGLEWYINWQVAHHWYTMRNTMTMILSHHGTSKLMYSSTQVYITAILSGDLFSHQNWHFGRKNRLHDLYQPMRELGFPAKITFPAKNQFWRENRSHDTKWLWCTLVCRGTSVFIQ